MAILVRPKVSFYFSLRNVDDADRAAVKADVKAAIALIDPVPNGDPAGTVRYKWDLLTPVPADDAGHIDKAVAKSNLDVQVALLAGSYGVGLEIEWCYLVRGGEIYCYHCYQLINEEGPVVVESNDYRIPMLVAYSWGAPF